MPAVTGAPVGVRITPSRRSVKRARIWARSRVRRDCIGTSSHCAAAPAPPRASDHPARLAAASQCHHLPRPRPQASCARKRARHPAFLPCHTQAPHFIHSGGSGPYAVFCCAPLPTVARTHVGRAHAVREAGAHVSRRRRCQHVAPCTALGACGRLVAAMVGQAKLDTWTVAAQISFRFIFCFVRRCCLSVDFGSSLPAETPAAKHGAGARHAR